MTRPWVLPLCLALVAGCGGSDEPAAQATPAAPPSAPAVQAEPSCSAGPATLEWPQPVPADLPVPPSATLTDVQKRTDGLTVVTFSTSTSIRQAVLFLIEQMPKAGYTLARGDAENTEADAPFVKGNLRGVMRMIAVEPCRTDWLMAITRAAPVGAPGGAPGGGSPLLPPRPGASPLPFG